VKDLPHFQGDARDLVKRVAGLGKIQLHVHDEVVVVIEIPKFSINADGLTVEGDFGRNWG